MPIYEFRNTKTDESFEEIMSIAEMEQYKMDNPHIVREFLTPIPIIDPVVLGVRKVDSGFKEMLKQVHETTPGSLLDNTVEM